MELSRVGSVPIKGGDMRNEVARKGGGEKKAKVQLRLNICSNIVFVFGPL
jgi:hypothetical protein